MRKLLPSAAWEGRADLERRVPIEVSAEAEGGRRFVVRGRRFAPLQVARGPTFHAPAATALGWYLLSYIPGGAPILKVRTRTVVKLLSALCCRSSSSGWRGGSGSA